MTRVLRENNHLNLRQIHMQRTVLSHKTQNQLAKAHRFFGVLEESGLTDAGSSGLSQKTSDPYNEIGESDARVV